MKKLSILLLAVAMFSAKADWINTGLKDLQDLGGKIATDVKPYAMKYGKMLPGVSPRLKARLINIAEGKATQARLLVRAQLANNAGAIARAKKMMAMHEKELRDLAAQAGNTTAVRNFVKATNLDVNNIARQADSYMGKAKAGLSKFGSDFDF